MTHIELEHRIAARQAHLDSMFNALITDICSKTIRRSVSAASLPIFVRDDGSSSDEQDKLFGTESQNNISLPSEHHCVYHAPASIGTKFGLRQRILVQYPLLPNLPGIKPCGVIADLLVALGAASLWVFPNQPLFLRELVSLSLGGTCAPKAT
ncbi:hypothetical protein ARMGADRAFT_1092332 [Armillaria gallica]|uniref:Uncharacterized protein n=1 Tax=Armillaria gallica TaxID=47427 RepID=A0A2H3CYF4_ARMGA|nr:hypothetical protein ARMGADRAFT_1092332 [Armillaria gallica]